MKKLGDQWLAQQLKHFLLKPEDLSSIPEFYGGSRTNSPELFSDFHTYTLASGHL